MGGKGRYREKKGEGRGAVGGGAKGNKYGD